MTTVYEKYNLNDDTNYIQQQAKKKRGQLNTKKKVIKI